MVHLKALPGSPGCKDSWEEILEAALADAEALCDGKVDGLQIENQFDWPFLLPEQIVRDYRISTRGRMRGPQGTSGGSLGD